MLIKLEIKNWMSYRDSNSFSMIATQEKQHRDRLPLVKKYRSRLLPVTALYGGNASGKSNLIEALVFAKNLVVRGREVDSPIPVRPYLLNKEFAESPTHFHFEILAEDDTIYDYRFSVDQTNVVSESLTKIVSRAERPLYRRRAQGAIELPGFTGERKQFLRFAAKGTRSNQLFLHNSISQGQEVFRPVYNWFRRALSISRADNQFFSFGSDGPESKHPAMERLISQLDTGIQEVGYVPSSLDAVPIPNDLKTSIVEDFPNPGRFVIGANSRFLISKRENEIEVKKLVSRHRTEEGSQVPFDFGDESDGSRRAFDLLPNFIDLMKPQSRRVFVIDELDRSLHTNLTKALLEGYLATCNPDSRSQLIFSTHDVMLMDQSFLRRDEMWISERSTRGDSSLISLSEYEGLRSDKDLRKSYLQGRFGGIPRIVLDIAGDLELG